MDANYAAEIVISSVKKSNLNFFVQESPFSLVINIRKTFIKNKIGNVLQPPTIDKTNEQRTKLEENSLEQLESQLNKTRNALHELSIELEKSKTETFDAVSKALDAKKDAEKLETENKALNLKNDDLQKKIEILKSEKNASNKNVKCKVKEISTLEVKNKDLEEQIENIEIEKNKLKEEVVIKDDEVRKTMDENDSLQEKLKSLLDVLYGCHECGLCECECSDSIKNNCDDSFLPPESVTSGEQSSPPTPPHIPAAQCPPPPNSAPWTPPPTPPCTSCGGVNFGPCPSSVCFGCIPPFENKLESVTGSPSRTPPGTPPPQHRLEQRAGRNRSGGIC